MFFPIFFPSFPLINRNGGEGTKFPAIAQGFSADNKTRYLLEKALDKLTELATAFRESGADVNPLILVQLPNNPEDGYSDDVKAACWRALGGEA